jgi:pimeloyl-ACP methyl ester carboxylesterase
MRTWSGNYILPSNWKRKSSWNAAYRQKRPITPRGADNQAVSGALVLSIPGTARVVVPGTGHLLYLEKPDLFSSIVISFLTSHGF